MRTLCPPFCVDCHRVWIATQSPPPPPRHKIFYKITQKGVQQFLPKKRGGIKSVVRFTFLVLATQN
jgi:hypothetical protein